MKIAINKKTNKNIDLSIAGHNKVRDCNVDLIRIIACCMVIGVHANLLGTGDIDKSRILFNILLGDGVSMFFVIMGFFLFRNSSFKNLLKKTFFRILLPTLSVILISDILFLWIFNITTFTHCINNININIKDIIWSIFNWNISR